jgi:hypothetical protein
LQNKTETKPAMLEVLNPRGVLPEIQITGLSNPRITDLAGKRIALLAEKAAASMFFDAMEELLKKKYPAATILRFQSSASPNVADNTEEIAAQCDTWMQGIKTSGSSFNDSEVKLERLGKPGITFSADSFVNQRRRLAEDNGMPTLRIVPISSEAMFACESLPEKIKPIAESVFDAAIEALTSPLTEAEKNPQPAVVDYGPITITGSSYTEACENFQQYCIDNQMGDGLPLIPPTKEAVDWMLTGTNRSPDEEIGAVAPRNGMATVEKIAINSVMAGARPEYLPVIITAIECLVDRSFNQYHLQNSGASPVALIWVNGPITEEIGMNKGLGYLGPGCRANSAIGRAINMCMINIGWRLVGGVAGLAGAPEGYCNFILPENEKDSPWESFSVEHGYQPEDSTVTINECFYCYRFGPSGVMVPQPTEKWLADLAGIIANTRIGSAGGRYCQIVLYPAFAKQLAAAGYTKQSLAQWLCDNSRLPWDRLSKEQQATAKAAAKSGNTPGLKPEDCQPGGTIPTLSNPKHIAILVSGDMAGYTVVFHSFGGSTAVNADNPNAPRGIDFMTKLIKGATLTKAGH